MRTTAKVRDQVLHPSIVAILSRDSHFFHVPQKLLLISHAFYIYLEGSSLLLFWWNCQLFVIKCPHCLSPHRNLTVYSSDNRLLCSICKGLFIHSPGFPGHQVKWLLNATFLSFVYLFVLQWLEWPGQW